MEALNQNAEGKSKVVCALYACEPPPPAGVQWRQTVRWLAATGVALGCALQCKYAMALTTLGWLGLQNVVTLAHVLADGHGLAVLLGQAALRGALLLGLPIVQDAPGVSIVARNFACVIQRSQLPSSALSWPRTGFR